MGESSCKCQPRRGATRGCPSRSNRGTRLVGHPRVSPLLRPARRYSLIARRAGCLRRGCLTLDRTGHSLASPRAKTCIDELSATYPSAEEIAGCHGHAFDAAHAGCMDVQRRGRNGSGAVLRGSRAGCCGSQFRLRRRSVHEAGLRQSFGSEWRTTSGPGFACRGNRVRASARRWRASRYSDCRTCRSVSIVRRSAYAINAGGSVPRACIRATDLPQNAPAPNLIALL